MPKWVFLPQETLVRIDRITHLDVCISHPESTGRLVLILLQTLQVVASGTEWVVRAGEDVLFQVTGLRPGEGYTCSIILRDAGRRRGPLATVTFYTPNAAPVPSEPLHRRSLAIAQATTHHSLEEGLNQVKFKDPLEMSRYNKSGCQRVLGIRD